MNNKTKSIQYFFMPFAPVDFPLLLPPLKEFILLRKKKQGFFCPAAFSVFFLSFFLRTTRFVRRAACCLFAFRLRAPSPSSVRIALFLPPARTVLFQALFMQTIYFSRSAFLAARFAAARRANSAARYTASTMPAMMRKIPPKSGFSGFATNR